MNGACQCQRFKSACFNVFDQAKAHSSSKVVERVLGAPISLNRSLSRQRPSWTAHEPLLACDDSRGERGRANSNKPVASADRDNSKQFRNILNLLRKSNIQLRFAETRMLRARRLCGIARGEIVCSAARMRDRRPTYLAPVNREARSVFFASNPVACAGALRCASSATRASWHRRRRPGCWPHVLREYTFPRCVGSRINDLAFVSLWATERGSGLAAAFLDS